MQIFLFSLELKSIIFFILLMVLLSFLVEVDAPISQVWNFFKNLESVPEWDPNIKKTEVIKKTQNQIGSVYDLTSQFYGKESTLRYETKESQETAHRCYRRFEGENSFIKAKDEIIVVKQSQNSSRISWKVDITLRGLWWMFTPFGYFGFKKLQTDGRQGCVKKCIDMFGKAREIK